MPMHDMGEYSPSQAQGQEIFRESRWLRALCDMSPMGARANIRAIRDMIEREMAEKGFSRRSLSSAAGLSESAVRDVLTKTDNPGVGTLARIAEALQIPMESIIGSDQVPLAGRIGAGGAIAYLDEGEEQSFVPRPPLAPGRLMALQVVGESMLPKYEPGDVVYVRRDHEGILPTYLGKYCAVHLNDGGTYLKILAAGSKAERYTLRSLNAADMENVEVIWASPVLFVMPRQ